MTSKKDFDITTVAGRKRLAPRNDPYYRREGNGHLGFRCTGVDGDGTWIGRAKEAGKYTYKPLGRFDDYRDALTEYNAWIDDLARATVAGVSKQARSMTLADATEHYLQHLENTRADAKACAAARRRMERILIGREKGQRRGSRACAAHQLASVKLSDLTKAHVESFRAGLLGKGVTEAKATRAQKATANREWRQFVAMLNHAHAKSLIGTDAAWAGIGAFGDTQARQAESFRYLLPKERRQIIDTVAKQFDDEAKSYVELLCYIGARPVELERLLVGDYDKKKGTLRLWGYKGKGSNMRERLVPVGVINGATAALDRVTKNKLPNVPIFNIEQNRRSLIMRTACDIAKVNDASAYCFRHSFITDCLNGGVLMHEVAMICGTSVAMIEKTYAKLLTENVERAFKNLRFA